ncbi:MAG: hypothetical protein K8R48_03690 [Alphaproteobacteria bacterium]|nr:hypothetical protein [Alphaproteobacteria bacterium]
MRKILIGTALASLFTFNAAKAQTPAQDNQERQVSLTWDPYATTMDKARVGIEYTEGKALPHLILGAGAYYNRGAGYLSVSTDATDGRTAKGGLKFVGFRPQAGIIFGGQVSGAVMVGGEVLIGRLTDAVNLNFGIRTEIGKTANEEFSAGGRRLYANGRLSLGLKVNLYNIGKKGRWL